MLDDDSVARRLLEAALTSEGYVVHTFGTMAHARAAVAREPYDLYLLDIVLPSTIPTSGNPWPVHPKIKGTFRSLEPWLMMADLLLAFSFAGMGKPNGP